MRGLQSPSLLIVGSARQHGQSRSQCCPARACAQLMGSNQASCDAGSPRERCYCRCVCKDTWLWLPPPGCALHDSLQELGQRWLVPAAWWRAGEAGTQPGQASSRRLAGTRRPPVWPADQSVLTWCTRTLRAGCMQANTTDDEGLERWPDAASAANIGIMLFRVAARKFAEARLHPCGGRPSAPQGRSKAPAPVPLCRGRGPASPCSESARRPPCCMRSMAWRSQVRSTRL